MKKYLITGALVLVTSATFISCHTDEDFGGSIVEQKMQAYQEVFEEEFGKVDPNQDWGFGTAELLARTRAAMSRTRADNADANMWANDWIVPQQLTPAQRLRVTRYFQTHKYPGDQPNYGTKNFFVQQVYDGADNPITNLNGFSAPTYSTETYVPGNGEAINSGEHMDHLTAGPAVEGNGHHILNFNNSTYGTDGEPNHDVANSTGVDYYNWPEDGWGINTNYENTHSDQIQLMLNHATYPWGYEDSSDSHLYTDCWTLVSAATIDAWADSDEAKALNIDLGDPVSTDGWNRDFIGFDFSLLVGDDIYEPVSYGSTELKKAKYDEYMYDAIWGWDGTNVVQIAYSQTNGIFNYAEGFDGYLYNGTEKVNLLSSNLNKYCVDLIGFGNSTADNKVYHNEIATEAEYVAGAENNNCAYITNVKDAEGNIIKKQGLYGETTKFLNLKWLNKMLTDGYLPVEGKAMKLWGKPTGCRDGYYSDWIVSFMPATPVNGQDPSTITIPIEPGSQGTAMTKDLYYKKTSYDTVGSGRVFCEDLGVVRASDIDFNDIVFDVYIYKTEYITKHMVSNNQGATWELLSEDTTSTEYDGDVWLLAGGGTIPVTIEVDQQTFDLKNVFNDAWGGQPTITDSYIVNTIKNDEGRYGNNYKNIDKAIKLNSEPLAITSVADVHVYVQYGTQFYELIAYKGVAPHKICVPIGTEWLLEREEISNGYPYFTRYVKYQDKDGNSLSNYVNNPGVTGNTGPEGGYIGDGDEYTFDERANSVWENAVSASLYVLPANFDYTPRHQMSGWTEEEIYLNESSVSGGGTNSGYQKNDPVLIRRRH